MSGSVITQLTLLLKRAWSLAVLALPVPPSQEQGVDVEQLRSIARVRCRDGTDPGLCVLEESG